LIPCGEKSEEIKRAIVELGRVLLKSDAIVYLSRKMLHLYQTIVKPLLEDRCPLHQRPLTFQERLFRISWRLLLSTTCEALPLSGLNIKLHVLEKSRLECYKVDDLGLEKEDDKEALRVALAAARRHERVFLVTSDSEFFGNLNYEKLRKRYEEARKVKVVLPNDSDLMSSLRVE